MVYKGSTRVKVEVFKVRQERFTCLDVAFERKTPPCKWRRRRLSLR
jgi:hypothetical protein